MAWAAIPAFLRARMNTNEILVTLMLTYIATLLLSFLVHGPVARSGRVQLSANGAPAGGGDVRTFRLCLPAQSVDLHHGRGSRHDVALHRIAASSATRCRERRRPPCGALCGLSASPSAVWTGLLAGGAAAGIAGMAEVAGPLGQLSPQISPGYGLPPSSSPSSDG